MIVTFVLGTGQLVSTVWGKGHRSSLDMATGTFLYMALCLYYLVEPGLSEPFIILAIGIIGFKVFFIYRAIRRDFQTQPHDKSDLAALIIGLCSAPIIGLYTDIVFKQMVYAVYILFFFTKALRCALQGRKELPRSLIWPILGFLIVYPAVFIVRDIYLMRNPPTTQLYSLDVMSPYTSLILLLLYTMVNLGIFLIAGYRAEQKTADLLEKALEERDFATGLVRIISHDVRNQLAGLSGAAELMADPTDPMIPLIRGNSRKAENLLTDLVYWGRSRIGKGAESPTDAAIAGNLMKKAIADTEEAAAVKGISLEYEYSAYVVNVDLTAARVVLRNILSNAVKFTPRGGTVSLSSAAAEKWLEISVSDQGPGLPASTMDSVRRGHHVHSAQGSDGEKGTGTGLQIAMSICNASKWKLMATPGPDGGTIFRLGLPTAELLD